MGSSQSVLQPLEEEEEYYRRQTFQPGNSISSHSYYSNTPEVPQYNKRQRIQPGNSMYSRNYYSNTLEVPQYTRPNQALEPSHPWQSENCPNVSHQMKYQTVSVPEARFSPYLDHAIVDDKDKRISSAVTFTNDQERRVYHPERTTGMWSSSGVQEKRDGNEGAVMINYTVVAPQPETGRWIKHYSSRHRILLVGDGDFSFAKCLARAFGFAPNMIATSLDSQDFLMRNYLNAFGNIVELGIRKCEVMHEIDATKMASHAVLGRIAFDRIVFNFPFAGFYKDLQRETQLEFHRALVNLFLRNAKQMLSANGEIHITHKTNGFHMEWGIESIAYAYGLRLIEAVDFNSLDYPGYNTKCGFGGDNNFNCYPSKTYKFRLWC